MIEASDAEKIEKDYLETLENLVRIVYEKAKEKRPQSSEPKIKTPWEQIKISDEISINVNNENIYKGKIDEQNLEKINPFISGELVDKLNKAIFNPQSLKGKVSIKIGGEEVFHVEDGVVIKDELGLSQAIFQAEKPELGLSQSLSEAEKPESQNHVQAAERTYGVEELYKQVEVLQNKLQEQQNSVNSLKPSTTEETIVKLIQQVDNLSKDLDKQQQLIEKTQQALERVNRSLPAIQNTQLQNWVGKIESGVKQTAKNLTDRIKNILTPAISKVRQTISQMKSQITNFQQKLRTSVAHLKNTAKQKVEIARGKAIENSVRGLLKIFGKSHSDGSFSFKSSNFTFEQQGDNIIVRAKNGDTILQNGELSPQVSEEQLQALDQVQFVVSQHETLERNARQESVSVSQNKIVR